MHEPSPSDKESAIKYLAVNLAPEVFSTQAVQIQSGTWCVDEQRTLKPQFTSMIRRLGLNIGDDYLDSYWHELVKEAVIRRQAGSYDFDLRVADLLRFAGPLLFDNEDENFPYSLGATCIFVRFRDRHFAVTPAHCLKGRTHQSIRIGAVEKSQIFLPVSRLVKIDKSEKLDSDWCDLAVMEIAVDRVSREELEFRRFLDLDDHDGRRLEFGANTPLVFKGYPYEISQIEYDLKEIGRLSFIGDCNFLGPAESKMCGLVRFNDLSGITNANGLSGSPLVRFNPLDETQKPTLPGLMLRATTESMSGRFVYIGSILNALIQFPA